MAIKKLFKSKSKIHGSDRKTKLAAPQCYIESFVLLVAFSTGFSTISDVQTPPPTTVWQSNKGQTFTASSPVMYCYLLMHLCGFGNLFISFLVQNEKHVIRFFNLSNNVASVNAGGQVCFVKNASEGIRSAPVNYVNVMC